MIMIKVKLLSVVTALSLILPVLILCAHGAAADSDYFNFTRADTPTLNDTTVLSGVIMTGNQINFTVLYTDADGDIGDVRVKFDKTNGTRGISGGGSYHAMNFDPSGNFSQGVTYWFVCSFDTPGNYTYTFNVTDIEANESVVENGTAFNVILPVPNEGKLFGRVTSGAGNDRLPVSNAIVIIHYYDNNTSITIYYNTTTNATGHYSQTLPIVAEPYFVAVNATGFFNSSRYKFQLLTIDNELEKNFTLDAWEQEIPGDITGELEGYIFSDNDEPVANASIIVVTYILAGEIDNITGNLTNETVRQYDNLTARSNSTGHYMLEGIAPGTWIVVASAEGYIDSPGELNISTRLVTLNFTMITRITLHSITGTILPPTATAKIGYSQITINASTGNFTMGIMNGDYVLTISAVGYTSHTLNVSVNGSDVNVGTIYLAKKVSIGPVKDAEGTVVAGATVTFTLNGNPYTAVTDSLGMAVFEIPYGESLAAGTEITAEKNGTSITWSHGDEIPKFAGEMPAVEEELSSTMIVVALAVMVILVLVAAVSMIKKS